MQSAQQTQGNSPGQSWSITYSSVMYTQVSKESRWFCAGRWVLQCCAAYCGSLRLPSFALNSRWPTWPSIACTCARVPRIWPSVRWTPASSATARINHLSCTGPRVPARFTKSIWRCGTARLLTWPSCWTTLRCSTCRWSSAGPRTSSPSRLSTSQCSAWRL